MFQLLVCTMNLPELAVSGSLTVDCAQLPAQDAGIVLFLKTVKLVGELLVVGLVCAPRSFATLAAVVCGPMGGLGNDASSFMSRARAAFCAAVGTNGLLLVAAWTTRPGATCPVLAAALRAPAGPVLVALPGAAPRSPANSSDTMAAATNTYHRRTAQAGRTVMKQLPFWRSRGRADPSRWQAGHVPACRKGSAKGSAKPVVFRLGCAAPGRLGTPGSVALPDTPN